MPAEWEWERVLDLPAQGGGGRGVPHPQSRPPPHPRAKVIRQHGEHQQLPLHPPSLHIQDTQGRPTGGATARHAQVSLSDSLLFQLVSVYLLFNAAIKSN